MNALIQLLHAKTHGYTYSYDTDSADLKSKEKQRRVKNGINDTLKNAFSKSNDEDLNVFYYVGHGLPATKENGYGGIPIGYYNNVLNIISSKDNEKISFVELINTLKLYKGNFIMIIDCCRAGAIYSAACEELAEADLNKFMFLVSTDYKTDEFADQLSRCIVSTVNNDFIKADENEDGCLTIPELFVYLKKEHPILWSYNKPTLSSNNIDFFGNLPVFQFNNTKMSRKTISLQRGKKYKLEVSLADPTITSSKIVFTSSDQSVATVDGNGKIKAKKVGTTEIKACLVDGEGNKCIGTESKCILNADIKGFFQHLDHEWIVRFIESRIKDPNIIRLVRRMLKAGIMNNYEFEATEEGSGQGSVCSPIISCIYMHYVLMWWFKEVVTPMLKGYAGLVVYADDCAPRRRKLVT